MMVCHNQCLTIHLVEKTSVAQVPELTEPCVLAGQKKAVELLRSA